MNFNTRGFTLFEIMVVLALIALVGLIVYPSLGTTLEKARMEGAVRDVATMLKYARQRAMAEQMVMAAIIFPKQGDLVILTQKDNKIIKKYHLWKNVSFYRVFLDGQLVESDRALVLFYPDGRSTGIALILRDKKGRQLRLKTDVLTGNTRILRPGEKGFNDEIFMAQNAQ